MEGGFVCLHLSESVCLSVCLSVAFGVFDVFFIFFTFAFSLIKRLSHVRSLFCICVRLHPLDFNSVFAVFNVPQLVPY